MGDRVASRHSDASFVPNLASITTIRRGCVHEPPATCRIRRVFTSYTRVGYERRALRSQNPYNKSSQAYSTFCTQCRWWWRPRKNTGSPALFQARTIAVGSALVAVAFALAIAPIAAFGDDAPTAPAVSPETAELLEVREAVEGVNEEAREEAPAAVGATCRATMDVEGVGDTCVTRDGLLRVEQADGRSHTIHGLDAPPTGAAAFAPTSQTAVNGASVADVTCVGTDAHRYVLVYARPGNVASRYTTIAPLLRTEIYKLSAFIDSESRSIDPAAGRRLPVQCSEGTPTVLEVNLSGLASGTAAFKDVVDAMRAQGYEFNGDGTGKQRYIVYYDAPSPSGAAGTGHVFTTDSSAGAANQNNKGGLYAIEYRFDQGGGVPHWDVLIHEVLHTMGGVVQSAPHSTAAGHCSDGQDVMCYEDGSGTFNPSACATKVLDCNRDDYFNPAPAAGSFLASNWNAAATYNSWLASHAGGALPADTGGLTQTGASSTAVAVSWNATAGASSYVVSIREPGGAWRDAVTTSRKSATIGGLSAMRTYEVGVATRATNGALGERAAITVSTNDQVDMVAPAAPTALRARHAGSNVTFTWSDRGDDVGVADFELRQVATSGRALRSAGRTPNTTLTIPSRGLKPGIRYQFEVIARDGASNASPAARVTLLIARDRRKPTVPSGLRASNATSSSFVLRWNPSRDNVAIKDYVLSQQVGRKWRALGMKVPANLRTVRIVKLRPGSTYVFRIQARDTSGNLSGASKTVRARTR